MKKNYIYHTICILLLLFNICPALLGQIDNNSTRFRRHFLIAYDVSGPFIKAEKSIPLFKESLVNLFSNIAVTNYSEANDDNLNTETRNNIPFFDKQKDEISFYHFNISNDEVNSLRNGSANKLESVFKDFMSKFIKNKNFSWTKYEHQSGSTINSYFESALNIEPAPSNFSNGVSMSNFVYPLIVNKLDSTTYAEEYVIILLSDFLTGSMFGNKQDLDRIKDIYRVPYNITPSPETPVGYIKKQIDNIASQFYKIDFFEYSFIPTVSAKKPIGIIGLKVKPKAGQLQPENIAFFLDGNLQLIQQGFENIHFKTNETKIKFTHNSYFIPNKLFLTVSSTENNKETTLFAGNIAIKKSDGKWVSDYSQSGNLLQFDSSKLTYIIPSLTIELPSIKSQTDSKNLIFKYEFATQYKVENRNSVNYIYTTERLLAKNSITYSTKTSIIIMQYVLPILVGLFILLLLAYIGKPRNLFLKISDPLDSYELTDYTKVGKMVTPFLAWSNTNPISYLKGFVAFRYLSPRFPFNWNTNVWLTIITDADIPEGFDLFLKEKTDAIKEFAKGNSLFLTRKANKESTFWIGLRQNDISKVISGPVLIKFKIEAIAKKNIFFVKSEVRQVLSYNFHIGADLGDMWVSFDPGTSGSCIAVGTQTANIILGKDSKGFEIIDSKLVIDLNEPYPDTNEKIPSSLVLHGTVASPKFGLLGFASFQSIKKLLGFKNVTKLTFKNSKTIEVTGKELASQLVKGIYSDLCVYVKNLKENIGEYIKSNSFNPTRAVVAIPNNFTITKAQEMLDCIESLRQFKEIRYIYEAEAVLFYYLSVGENEPENISPKTKIPATETVLVFDMGGATINATVVSSTRVMVDGLLKYQIEYLGKIGYGIGGDTIDYCLVKLILSATDEFPELKSIDFFKLKKRLADLAEKIKREMVFNYPLNSDYLIRVADLERYINLALNINISLKEDSQLYAFFKKDTVDKSKLTNAPFFKDLVYRNVEDAANEAIALSGNIAIDRVIFSGRSAYFPYIRETVNEVLKKKRYNTREFQFADIDEAKKAVALGACWYGINKKSIILSNNKTNASFGFKKTLSADRNNVRFYELVKMGHKFDMKTDQTSFFTGKMALVDDFSFDGTKINFYQIMGNKHNEILSENQKHKFSKIATISLPELSAEVAMKVNENDMVECFARLESNRVIDEKGVVADQEVEEANEEHYTWILK